MARSRHLSTDDKHLDRRLGYGSDDFEFPGNVRRKGHRMKWLITMPLGVYASPAAVLPLRVEKILRQLQVVSTNHGGSARCVARNISTATQHGRSNSWQIVTGATISSYYLVVSQAN